MALKYIKSATIILEKTTGEILLCHRNPELKAFPDMYVFPGGKIEEKLPDKWNGDELEVKDTILREMYEEIGILPGVPYTIPSNERKRNWLTWDYSELERELFLNNMRYIGRKRTPLFLPKSFDTAYFIIKHEMVNNFEPIADGSEILELLWIKPQEALQLRDQGKLKMVPPTVHILRTMVNEYDHLDVKTLVESQLPIGLQTRVEFASGIMCIPMLSNTIEPFISTNLIIINSSNESAIVDPGTNDLDHLKQILSLVDDLKYVIITHEHKDHWEALELIEEEFPRAIICAHADTQAKIDSQLEKIGIEQNLLVGNKTLQLIHTPGHTFGHITIFDQETGVLLAGDHIVGFGSAVLDPETGNMKQYFESTRMLKNLNPKLILPAHGPPVYHPEKKLEEYIQHREDREKSILNAINSGAKSLDDIVKIVYQDVPQKMWEYAKRNIQLHIDKLIEENTISGF